MTGMGSGQGQLRDDNGGKENEQSNCEITLDASVVLPPCGAFKVIGLAALPAKASLQDLFCGSIPQTNRRRQFLLLQPISQNEKFFAF